MQPRSYSSMARLVKSSPKLSSQPPHLMKMASAIVEAPTEASIAGIKEVSLVSSSKLMLANAPPWYAVKACFYLLEKISRFAYIQLRVVSLSSFVKFH